jgi:DNA primase
MVGTDVDSAGSDSKTLVLNATDIVELIGQTVSLKRRGKSYTGLCPFHQEKTPSFSVNPQKQFFYCFGCKASGNAIDFVMKRDRVEFKDALLFLAQKSGIELPKFGANKEQQSQRQVLLELHSAACSLFEKWLSDSMTGKPARDYLASRGFTPETIRKFQVGYVPDSWDALMKSPVMKGYPASELQLAGLVKARENENGFYDTFRHRLMFPIRDEQGRVIAFGGRVMPGSDAPAKYLNSPETPLFSKSRTVYGLDLARQKIVETRIVAVVEGYTDVVMAHQYGATNVVSILGTAMTEQHVTILRRFAEKIVLLFDADLAGDLAVNRAVELFITQPIEIAIASIPEDLDPDEYLLKHGLEAFNLLLANAQDALTYKWKQLSRKVADADDVTGRQRAVEEYLETLATARRSGRVDNVRWDSALARVSRLTDLGLDTLRNRFKAVRKPKPLPYVSQEESEVVEPEASVPIRRGPLTDQDRAEQWILGILLNEPSRWHEVQQHLRPEEFMDALHQKLAQIYWDHSRDEGEVQMPEFLDHLPEATLKELTARLVQETEDLTDLDRILTESLAHFDGARQRKMEQKLVADIRRTMETKDDTSSESRQSDEIELLKRLQEQAKRPDLKRTK